jgi:hypothetical protein
MSELARSEEAALWAIVAIGAAALGGFAWDVAVNGVDPPDPPPMASPPPDNGRSLAEFALAPEANANNIGVRLASEGKLAQAIESFRYALRTDPGYLPGHKNLLAALVESGRWPEALGAVPSSSSAPKMVRGYCGSGEAGLRPSPVLRVGLHPNPHPPGPCFYQIFHRLLSTPDTSWHTMAQNAGNERFGGGQKAAPVARIGHC